MFRIFLIINLAISLSQIALSQQGWYQLTLGTSYNLQSVRFTDVNTGYAVGFNGTVLKTTNGGLNWTSQPIGTTEELYSVHFIGQTGYVVGGANTLVIFKTTNGGTNWISQFVAGVSALHSVFMTDSVTAYAVGHNGKIIKTTNGGINWSVYDTSLDYHLNSIFFVNANTGYAGGTFTMHAGGVFLRTNNGGISWVATGGECYSIYFINSETGYRAGYGISKTTNSGTNWVSQPIGGNNSFRSVWFSNLSTGYLAGQQSSNGTIFKTSNGGLNWNVQAVPSVGALYSVFFIDANTGYAAGNSGTILKTTNGGVTGLEPLSNEIPIEYKLYQNYPNPFNPVTKIKFQLKDAGLAQLVIYDILGREAASLVNEELKPGTYEIDFDGSSYASGIYYYKLVINTPHPDKSGHPSQEGNYVETKKMVLIK